MTRIIWDEATTEKLRQMWKDRYTGREIAEALHVSRSAVLGRINRLGLLRITTEERNERRRSRRWKVDHGNNPASFWTKEKVDELKKLFVDGRSNPEIAVLINAPSHRAVGAKLQRMGLRRQVAAPLRLLKAARPSQFVAVNAERRKHSKAGTDYASVMPTEIPLTAKPWTERRFGECAFPVAGEGADLLSCCGATGGETYCRPHWNLMHTPSKANEGLKKACLVRNLRRAA